MIRNLHRNHSLRLRHLMVSIGLALGIASGLSSADAAKIDLAEKGAAPEAKMAAARPKKIYAHYMGCFPIGDPPGGKERFDAKLRHDSPDPICSVGGAWRDYPLVPYPANLTLDQKADLEIRRAMRAGIDGFDMDAWAGGENAREVLDALFRVTEAKDYPFELTICLDHSCLRPEVGELGAIRYLLDKHGKSPKLARRDGKPLIFTYHASDLLLGTFTDDEMKWAQLGVAFKDLEEKVGQPLYFMADLQTLFRAQPSPKDRDDIWSKAAGGIAKDFGGVGLFLDRDLAPQLPVISKAVRAAGAEWCPPIWFQYDNPGMPLIAPVGTALLRRTWDGARNDGATLLQFVTWNDYTEYTNLSPTTSINYGIDDLNNYFAQWWKTGTPPVPDHDKVYVTYRKYAPGSKVFPFQEWRRAPDGMEVLTILPHPATVRLPGRTDQGKPIEYEAPSGMFVKVFPTTPGAIEVEVVRNGKVQTHLRGQEYITDKPFRQDNTLQCVSTEDERCWKEDFPDTPYPRECEYGDDNHNGLPNWFEMYWFGKWGDYSTATGVDPKGDPDGDGKTNLAEYNNQTDPTKKPAKYAAGAIWNLFDIYPRKISINPDQDQSGTPVWHYLYKTGEKPLLHDGNYTPCPETVVTSMIHYSQGSFIGWRPHNNAKLNISNESPHLQFEVGGLKLMALAWESPVDGNISIQWKIASGATNKGVSVSVERSNPWSELWKHDFDHDEGGQYSLQGVPVKKGDKIFFVVEPIPGLGGRESVGFDQLVITLDAVKNQLR